MKKLIASLGITLMMPISALAASPAEILNQDTEFLFSLDPEKMDEDISYYYNYLLDQIKSKSGSTLESALAEMLESAKISIAANLTEETAVGFIEMTQAEFDKLISDHSPKESSVNPGFYIDPSDGAYFTYDKGQFITTDEEDALSAIISYNESTLSEASDFKEIFDQFTAKSFFNLYGKLDNVFDELFGEELPYNVLTDAIVAEGLSVEHADNTFYFKSNITLNESEVLASGVDLDNKGVPKLYKFMPNGTDMIYFLDSKSTININKLKEDPNYQEFQQEFQDLFDTDLSDLLIAIEDENALLINDSATLIPDITFMSDVSKNEAKVKLALSNVSTKIWDGLKLQADDRNGETLIFDNYDEKVSVSKGSVKLANSNVDQYTIKYSPKVNKNPYAPRLSDEDLTLKLTVGVTGDDVLIISTKKDIADDYGTPGISKDPRITKLVAENPNGFFYFNPENLNNYFQDVLTIIENASEEGLIDLSDGKEILNTIFSPWGEITGTSSFTNSSVSGELNLTVDLDEISETYNLQMFSAGRNINDLEIISNAQNDYQDVSTNHWFGNDVYYLSTKGIIKGYSDGEFKPNQTINRAEFTKLIIEVLGESGYIDSSYSYALNLDGDLTDVDSTAWYYQPIGKAYRAGLIKGYSDKTFHPGGNISRAEAAQIITNVLVKYKLEAMMKQEAMSNPNFADVSTSDWYFAAVKRVWSQGIMTGKTTSAFAPNENLNRAEAAKIVRNLLKMIETSK